MNSQMYADLYRTPNVVCKSYRLQLKTETHRMYSSTYTSHFKGKETSLQLGNCANCNINQTEIQSLADN